jgi:GT2 family glycosyltransferase
MRIKRTDEIFPEGTRRGEFRKVVAASLRVITEQGIRSFWKQAMTKVYLREFRVIDPLVARHASASDTNLTQLSLVSEAMRLEFSDEILKRNLTQFISTDGALEFPAYNSPTVSVVIVAYNKAPYTFQCLRSALESLPPPFELIIVDNASTDDTSALLARIRGARVIRNRKNRFFGPACNQGASVAKGKHLLFLNSDAFVREGCISSLVNTMESAPDVGAAGAKLIWRNGLLQEAGSIVWRDGSALGYGRGDDPSKPEYCYARDVDYCSAACLMVRSDLFENSGGFDERFTPAYYEDTDLCMRLWTSGYRVVYDPGAVAVHVEYAGTSFDTAERLMAMQQSLFVAKHRKTLGKHLPFSERNVIRARSRKDRPTILVIDDCVPKPSDGSGYPRMFSMLKSMASLGYPVTLLPLTDATPKKPETDILTRLGVEVLWGNTGARQLLESRRDSYDMVLISRPPNALLAMNLTRKTNPKALVIYDAEALWYRREQLKRSLGYRSDDRRFTSEEAELSLIRSADYVVAVSETEKKFIQEKLADSDRVVLLGHSHTVVPTLTQFEDRQGLLFLAGFKSARMGPGPNDDAAINFAKNVLPRIRAQVPGVKFVIAGSNQPQSVKQLASDTVSVIGYVKDIRQLFEKSRLFVVPIRFAAGALWKVTEAMSYGLPCVLSMTAAQGLEIRDGDEALIARDEDDMVEKIVRLYQDKALWRHVRENGLEYVTKNCDPTLVEERLGAFLKKISQARKS